MSDLDKQAPEAEQAADTPLRAPFQSELVAHALRCFWELGDHDLISDDANLWAAAAGGVRITMGLTLGDSPAAEWKFPDGSNLVIALDGTSHNQV